MSLHDRSFGLDSFSPFGIDPSNHSMTASNGAEPVALQTRVAKRIVVRSTSTVTFIVAMIMIPPRRCTSRRPRDSSPRKVSHQPEFFSSGVEAIH